MKKNMGTIDKLARILAALTVGVLFVTHIISGTLAIILMILAGVFLLTSMIGSCPLYLPFGISTKERSAE
jgi:K+-transporting ATPase A subunit